MSCVFIFFHGSDSGGLRGVWTANTLWSFTPRVPLALFNLGNRFILLSTLLIAKIIQLSCQEINKSLGSFCFKAYFIYSFHCCWASLSYMVLLAEINCSLSSSPSPTFAQPIALDATTQPCDILWRLQSRWAPCAWKSRNVHFKLIPCLFLQCSSRAAFQKRISNEAIRAFMYVFQRTTISLPWSIYDTVGERMKG